MSKNEPPPPPHDHAPRKGNPELPSSRGIGDTFSKFIQSLTRGKINECEPCKNRKEKLNKMFPYKKNEDEDKVQDD